MIKTEVAGATSSMSSIPKPLKFLSPMYDTIKTKYEAYKTNDSFKVSIEQSFYNHYCIEIIL